MTEGETVFLQKVSELVLSHLGDTDFTTGRAAAELGISRMHLNRLLGRLTGLSTHEYLLSARLRSARMLLLSRPLPVRVIAALVGFRSHAHFAKAFRRATGMRPTEYRKARSRLRSSLPPSQPNRCYSRDGFGYDIGRGVWSRLISMDEPRTFGEIASDDFFKVDSRSGPGHIPDAGGSRTVPF